MPRRDLPLLASAACFALACTDVRIVPQGGNGGEPPIGGFASAGGFDANGGFTSVGGFNTGGAPIPTPIPDPVPGCEALELTGEPVLIAASGAPPWDENLWLTRLAPADGGRVGLVYQHGGPPEGQVGTRIIEDAFWPPTISEAVIAYEGSLGNTPRLDSSPLNGGFTLGFSGFGIYSFEEPGALRQFEDGWIQAFVRSGPVTPFHVVTTDFNAQSYGLLSFDSLVDESPAWETALPVNGCRTARMASSDTGTLLSLGSDYYCTDEPRVAFFRRVDGGVEVGSGFELPDAPDEQWLEPRPGGYWYFTSSQEPGVGSFAYPLDESGELTGEPWHDDYTYGDFTPRFRSWRNGFVGTHREDGVLSFFVSDGVNRTNMAPIPGTEGEQSLSSRNDLAVAVMGLDASSFMLAYPTLDGVLIARAACVTQ